MSTIAAPFEASAVAERALPRPLAAAVPTLFVVPAFNEEDNLPRLIDDLESRPQLFPPGSRVIVVDDGSSDGTAALVERYDGPLPIGVLESRREPGPGRRLPRRFRSRARRVPLRRRARGHARGGQHERSRRAPDDARPRPVWRRPGACLGPRRRPDGQRRPAAPRAQQGRRSRRPSRARPRRAHGLVVLPRLPRVGAPRRPRALRRRADPGARFRVQGGAAREADRGRRTRRGGPGRSRRLSAGRQEQDVNRPDTARLLAPRRTGSASHRQPA